MDECLDISPRVAPEFDSQLSQVIINLVRVRASETARYRVQTSSASPHKPCQSPQDLLPTILLAMSLCPGQMCSSLAAEKCAPVSANRPQARCMSVNPPHGHRTAFRSITHEGPRRQTHQERVGYFNLLHELHNLHHTVREYIRINPDPHKRGEITSMQRRAQSIAEEYHQTRPPASRVRCRLPRDTHMGSCATSRRHYLSQTRSGSLRRRSFQWAFRL